MCASRIWEERRGIERLMVMTASVLLTNSGGNQRTATSDLQPGPQVGVRSRVGWLESDVRVISFTISRAELLVQENQRLLEIDTRVVAQPQRGLVEHPSSSVVKAGAAFSSKRTSEIGSSLTTSATPSE